MVSVIYASISAFFIVWLSLVVIKIRRKRKVSVGDGGNEELQTAMGAQSNAIEYIPIAILLLYGLEFNGAHKLLIHLFGVSLITGRLIHAHGLFLKKINRRVLGMQVTIYVLLGLAIANLIFIPYNKFI